MPRSSAAEQLPPEEAAAPYAEAPSQAEAPAETEQAVAAQAEAAHQEARGMVIDIATGKERIAAAAGGQLTASESEESAAIAAEAERAGQEYSDQVMALLAEAKRENALDNIPSIQVSPEASVASAPQAESVPAPAAEAAPAAEVAPIWKEPAPGAKKSRKDEAKAERSAQRFEALKHDLESSGKELAALEIKLRRDPDDADLLRSRDAAKEKYDACRFKYVGESVERLSETRVRQIEAQREILEKEKGFLPKVFEWYKKSGELNVAKLCEKMGWKPPTSRAGKVLAKVASVRTGISLAMVGAGAVFGAGSAVGIGAIAGRRLLSGMGSGLGTYNFLKSAHEGRLAAGFSAEQLDSMPLDEVIGRMEELEANSLAGGKSVVGNKPYGELRTRYVELVSASQTSLKSSGGSLKESLKGIGAAAEYGLDQKIAAAKKADRVRKGIGLAVGLTVGSGALAKAFGNVTRWFGESTGLIKKTAAEAPAAHPAAEAAPDSQSAAVQVSALEKAAVQEVGAPAGPPLSEKMLEASEVRAGDGYAKIIRRDLLAEPDKFGYDAARDGEVGAWANKTAGRVLRDNGLASSDGEMRLRFNPHAAEKAHVALRMKNGRIAIDESGVSKYAYHKPHAAPAEAAIEPPKFVEQKITGAPVSVEGDGFKFEGNYEATGSHAEPLELGHVEHEFGHLSPEALAKSKEILNAGFEEHLGKGAQKSPELIKHLLSDRQEKLFELKQGYEAALQAGKIDLAQRLHGDYNVLADATNRDIADAEVFKKLPKFKAPKLSAVAEAAPESAPAQKAAKAAVEAKGAAKPANVLEFKTGPSGEIADVVPVQDLSPEQVAESKGLLYGDWMDRAAAAGRWKSSANTLRSTVFKRAEEIYALEHADRSGLAPGQLKKLKWAIATKREKLKDLVGDILKPSA